MSRRTRKTATVSSLGAMAVEAIGERPGGVGAVEQLNDALGGRSGE